MAVDVLGKLDELQGSLKGDLSVSGRYQFQRGMKLAQEANPKIVRQNGVVKTAHHVL